MLLYYLYSADRVGTSEARRNNWLKIVHGTWAAWWGRWGSAQLQTNNSLFIFIFLHIFFLPWSSVGTGGTDCRVIFSLLNKQQCLPVLCRNSGAPLWGSPITERNVTSSASLYCRFQACPFISGRIFSYMHLEILGKIHSLSVLMPYQQYCICQRATVNNLYNDTTNHKTFSNINI